MKREDYRPLGEYIQIVDERNRDGAINNLVGVSFEKKIIPSIANTIGTDLSNYRIIKPGQFAYCPVTSRNGDRISIALYKGNNNAILSVAYTVFEITKPQDLDSDYLMLWVSRPEFDRYARFMSHGSVRELFSWEEMCNVMLPVPSIEEQRRIVAEYQTVERRIKNNEALIQKLEETAQAIYHHTFVEGIDENNLPEGWKKDIADNTFDITIGKTPPRENPEFFTEPTKGTKWVSIADMKQSYPFILNTNEELTTDAIIVNNVRTVKPFSILYSFKMTVGRVAITRERMCTNEAIAHFSYNEAFYPYIYYYLKDYDINKLGSTSSITQAVNSTIIKALEIVIPPHTLLCVFSSKVKKILEYQFNLQRELTHLRKLQSLLTSKLA